MNRNDNETTPPLECQCGADLEAGDVSCADCDGGSNWPDDIDLGSPVG